MKTSNHTRYSVKSKAEDIHSLSPGTSFRLSGLGVSRLRQLVIARQRGTNKAFAKAAGVTAEFVGKIRNGGVQGISVAYMTRLAPILGLSIQGLADEVVLQRNHVNVAEPAARPESTSLLAEVQGTQLQLQMDQDCDATLAEVSAEATELPHPPGLPVTDQEIQAVVDQMAQSRKELTGSVMATPTIIRTVPSVIDVSIDGVHMVVELEPGAPPIVLGAQSVGARIMLMSATTITP